ncbi:MAG: hypothetical protein BIFFINMI_00882 [Phycisphaerae bacterium]|nr:hypothetical protein [Phycisphaerae bacterium]
MTAFVVILAYLALLLALGLVSNRFFRGTATDYFLASRGIGPFLLVMSLFGTTMTAFALVGSTGESWKEGIGVYGMLASSSGIVHSACFFLVGIKLWSWGKRYGYVTQIQFFRDRFQSPMLGLLLFPILVGLVIPYLLIGVIGAGITIEKATVGAMPGLFPGTHGAIPFWFGAALTCLIVLTYVFFGGVRGTAWANAFQTIVFVGLGVVTFLIITGKLGGAQAATAAVMQAHPEKLTRAGLSKLHFTTYLLIPLSVAMFPHLFQHWLTARSARTFRLSVVAHPLLILLVWAPCVLIGVWATAAMIHGKPVVPPGANENAVLGLMVNRLTGGTYGGQLLGGLLTAGILAAIMSSLDSQFLCIGSIFTHDVVGHYLGHERLSERARVVIGRGFVILVVLVTYLLALTRPGGIFTLGVWTFSGFAGLFPVVLAACYWKRASAAGVIASVLVTAGTWLWLFARAGWGAEGQAMFLGMMPVATIVAASSAVLVGVSLLTPAPSDLTLSRFFGRPRPVAATPTRAVTADVAATPAEKWVGKF